MNMEFFLSLLSHIFSEFFSLITNPIILFMATVAIVSYIIVVYNYKKTTYYQQTKTPYLKLRSDLGKLGEYMIYKNLRRYEKSGAKFLFNIYVPKKDEETTEIDVIMICKKGIFVFESKNYSGWIFGDEKSFKWTQTLPSGKRSHKETFYNPIMQNRTHIKFLSELLTNELPLHSIIAFSDRCTFKNLTVTSKDVKVINRYFVDITVENICKDISNDVLSDNDIITVYNELFPYTQVEEAAKERHIQNIKENLSVNNANAKQTVPEAEVTEQTEDDLANISVKKCPKCGGELVERIAKRGDKAGQRFLGCSNFPKCKYIE